MLLYMAQVQAFYDLEKLALFVRVIDEKDFYAHVCYYICVLILLYMCPTTGYVSSHCCICVLILLYMCPHTAMYVSSYCYVCVLILLYMCPHTAVYVS